MKPVAAALPASVTPAEIARIDGQILKVEKRGKQLFCFEGLGLRKLGVGEVIHAFVGTTRYAGELVAIGPTRAILFVNPVNADHGITVVTK